MSAQAAAGGWGGSPALALLLVFLTGLALHMSRVSPHVRDGTQGGPQAGEMEPDGGVYENQLPERLDDELEAARQVEVQPIRPDHPSFDAVLNQGKIKYVVTETGELLVAPHSAHGVEISHAVLAGGRPVLAAGEADIAVAGGRYIGITLTRHSGHFRPGLRSLEVARRAFEAVGIVF